MDVEEGGKQMDQQQQQRHKRIPMGAFDKLTNVFVLVSKAQKHVFYACPECKQDVFLRGGDKRTKHFCHRAGECNYFDRCPGESEIHKEAKRIMRFILEQKWNIVFHRDCLCCDAGTAYEMEEYDSATCKVESEYRFLVGGNQKIADIAYLKNGERVAVIEIFHTHPTREKDRDGMWFEIHAEKLVMDVNQLAAQNIHKIQIECVRYPGVCENCRRTKEDFITEDQRLYQIAFLDSKMTEYRQCLRADNLYADEDRYIRMVLRRLQEQKKLLCERVPFFHTTKTEEEKLLIPYKHDAEEYILYSIGEGIRNKDPIDANKYISCQVEDSVYKTKMAAAQSSADEIICWYNSATTQAFMEYRAVRANF